MYEAGVRVEAVDSEDGVRRVLVRECGRARHDVRHAYRPRAPAARLRVEQLEVLVVRVREELRPDCALVALHDALVVARPLL